MKRFHSIITGMALLLAPTVLLAAESLWDVYRIAARSDPELQAAVADHAATLEVLPQSRAGLLPDIGFNGTVDRLRFEDLESGGDTTFSTDQIYTLTLTQPIFRYDRFVQFRQADSRILQAEAELTAAEQDLMIRTATRYFEVLGTMDDLQFARSEKGAIARQLDQTKQRFDVGLIAITDVHEAQARYDLAVSEEIKAETQLENAREALAEITGTPHGNLQVLEAELPLLTPDPQSPEQWVNKALEQNYQYLAAQAAAETARQEIEHRRSGHYPSLDFNLNQSYRDQNFGGVFGLQRYDSSIGLELNLPIFQGGRVRSQTTESRALFDAAQQRAELQRRAAQRQMRDAYRAVVANIALVHALEQALVSTRTALEAAEAGFDVGTRTIVDVLNAQREVFRARRDFARARYDYLLNTLQMKLAAGTLSGDDVKQVSSYLQVKAAPGGGESAP